MQKDGMSIKDKMSMQVGKGPASFLKLSGVIELELFGPDGKRKQYVKDTNTVTTLGLAMAADQFDDTPTIAQPGWMEVGTGTGQGAGDSILSAYIAGSRTANTTATTTGAAVAYVCTLGAGVGTGPITEAGLFNVVTENTTNMILYDDFSVINKAAGDSLAITWTLTFA